MMTPTEIAQVLSQKFPDAGIEFADGAKLPVTNVLTGDPCIFVSSEKIKAVLQHLKDDGRLAFDCLSNLTAVDRKELFEVVYHLFSYTLKHSVTIKVRLPRDENAHIETVEGIWKTANWLEREVYDLFGIKFDQHSDLRRIMLPDDWEGYPLRKDYKEAEDYHGIATTRPPLLQ